MLMYWLCRRLERTSNAVLPAVFFLMISIPIWPGTNHHWDSNLFALLAVAAFCLWQDQGKKAFLLLSGVVAGITSCFLQQKGLFLFLALLVVTFISSYQAKERKSQIFSHLGLLTAGYTGVGGLVLMFFYLAGGLNDLLYANLIWPLSNYRHINVVPYGYSLFELFKPQWELIYNHLFSPPWAKTLTALTMIPFFLILSLPLLLTLMIVGCCLNRASRAQLFNPTILSYIILGLALWVSELHRKDIFHLIYGSPLLLIVAFILFKNCLGNKRIPYWLMIGILSLGSFSLAAFNAAVATSVNHSQPTRRGNIQDSKEDGALDFLLKNTKPGDPVFIYPYYPMYYFLADVKNPTRYSILLYSINTEAQFNEVIQDLEKAKVKFVLWDTLVSGDNLRIWFPQYRQPEKDSLILEKYLNEHYEILVVKNKFKIMRRREN